MKVVGGAKSFYKGELYEIMGSQTIQVPTKKVGQNVGPGFVSTSPNLSSSNPTEERLSMEIIVDKN